VRAYYRLIAAPAWGYRHLLADVYGVLYWKTENTGGYVPRFAAFSAARTAWTGRNMTDKRRLCIIINAIFVVLMLAFIWTRSMKSAEASRTESLAVLDLIRPLFELLVGKGNVTNHMVRKLAHFTEFCLLGAGMVALFRQMKRRCFRDILLLLTAGLCCAFIDEGIQFFFDRGSQLTDVLLDFISFGVGAAAVLLISRGSVGSERRNG